MVITGHSAGEACGACAWLSLLVVPGVVLVPDFVGEVALERRGIVGLWFYGVEGEGGRMGDRG